MARPPRLEPHHPLYKRCGNLPRESGMHFCCPAFSGIRPVEDLSRDSRPRAAPAAAPSDRAAADLSPPRAGTQRRITPLLFRRRLISASGIVGSFFRRAITARSSKSCRSSSCSSIGTMTAVLFPYSAFRICMTRSAIRISIGPSAHRATACEADCLGASTESWS
jgi:hypothetical protein